MADLNPGFAGIPQTIPMDTGATLPHPAMSESQNDTDEARGEKLMAYWETRKTFFTEEQHKQAWEATADIVKKSSDEMVERWNKEIDTLLVYAGLFSAILTAFNVQSYPLLTPPPPDQVLLALQQISSQLSSYSVSSSSVNATYPAFNLQPSSPSPPPEQWVVWLNAVWFASLIFSLSAASVGIMVKQWLNQYSSGLSGSSQHIARLRQHRLNSLQKWCVGGIVSILPVLLQVGAVLFFAGLLILLWVLHQTVAMVASTLLVGALASFLVATIVIPAFTSDCPYLSPASVAIRETLQPAFHFWYRFRKWLNSQCRCSRRLYNPPGLARDPLMSIIAKILRRLCSYPSDISLGHPTRGRELLYVTRNQTQLDGDMVATAYATVMDHEYLDTAAICFTDISPGVAILCFDRIRTQDTRHGGLKPYHPCMWSGVVVASLCCRWTPLVVHHRPWSFANLKTAIDYLVRSSRTFPEKFNIPPSSWTRLSCADHLHAIRSGDSDLTIHQWFSDCTLDLPSLLLAHLSFWVARINPDYDFLGGDRDLRISIAVGMAEFASPSGPCSGWEVRSDTLDCLLGCIPHPDSPEYDEGTFQDIVRLANRALLHLADALFKFNKRGAIEDDLVLSTVWTVCRGLHRFEMMPQYGKVAGFPPPHFMEAVHDYLGLWESQDLDLTNFWLWIPLQEVRKQVDAYRCGEDRQRQNTVHVGTLVVTEHEDEHIPTSVCLRTDTEPGEGQREAAAVSGLAPLPGLTHTADG
ncbi:hypothetical protein OH76DRAFT_1404351 [Lentinus brumalis]|uniref:DUF6535 domain-containing protein n=1 Tax=Lentinus brumalis TaxID=2498619 RepID=A0A371D8H7_9APHY|nr:hypothetical protein OH76DRAFT_1404351 [Polyporus brumalis]